MRKGYTERDKELYGKGTLIHRDKLSLESVLMYKEGITLEIKRVKFEEQEQSVSLKT